MSQGGASQSNAAVKFRNGRLPNRVAIPHTSASRFRRAISSRDRIGGSHTALDLTVGYRLATDQDSLETLHQLIELRHG